MSWELIIEPKAEAEMADAFDWYETRVRGLGFEFLRTVDALLHSIARRPRQYPVVYKDIHRALTRRFPYEVFFVIDRTQIVVVAVFHAKRNPREWRERID